MISPPRTQLLAATHAYRSNTVKSLKAAIEKLNWYAMRWKIEVFHKILKSGCKAEESKLRSSERLVNLIAIFCIIGWRVFWLTMLHRALPDLAPAVALDTSPVTCSKSALIGSDMVGSVV